MFYEICCVDIFLLKLFKKCEKLYFVLEMKEVYC